MAESEEMFVQSLICVQVLVRRLNVLFVLAGDDAQVNSMLKVLSAQL